MANRECLRVLRDTARTVVVPDVGPVDADPGPEQVVVDEMERAELRAAVTAALATLPPRRRELLAALFADMTSWLDPATRSGSHGPSGAFAAARNVSEDRWTNTLKRGIAHTRGRGECPDQAGDPLLPVDHPQRAVALGNVEHEGARA